MPGIMALNYSLTVFQEPRGMMRILQFIFAICAFATTANFSVDVGLTCTGQQPPQRIHHLDYPFRFDAVACSVSNTSSVPLALDVSSDAQFYVATGVLSMLYCGFIIAVYAYLDDLYRSKPELPLADFMITTVLAVFWLAGSAAWSNGTSALKAATDATELSRLCASVCQQVVTGSFSRLNISLLLGFLNFFLWASDLWFLYKETIWFQGRQSPQNAADQQQQHQQQQQQAPGQYGAGTSSGFSPTA